MPGGSRLVRASHGPSRQVTIPQVLSALYGPSICTLRTLLLRLLTVPSELGPQAANPLFLNAEGQGNADWVSPPAGSNQTLYSELLNDIRSSALFPNSANSADRNPQSSEQVDHADEVLCVTKAAEIAGTLVRDADPEDYVNLLDKTLVALRDGAPQSVNFEFEQRWTQKEVVERVIQLQFRRSQRPTDVLCAGYRKLRPGTACCSKLEAPRGLECTVRNSSVEILKAFPWVTLLSRVGDAVMLYLLSNASIFVAIGGSSFLQVVGPPINTVASTSKLPTFLGFARKNAKSQSSALSGSSAKEESRSVLYPDQALKGTVQRLQWKASFQEPISTQPHEAEKGNIRNGRKKRRLKSEIDVTVSLQQDSGSDRRLRGIPTMCNGGPRFSEAIQHISTATCDGYAESPSSTPPLVPPRSKRSRLTSKRTAPSSDWVHELAEKDRKQSSEPVKRCRLSAVLDVKPLTSSICGSILTTEAKQGDETKLATASDYGVHKAVAPLGTSQLTTKKRVRPTSWQRHKAQLVQHKDAVHLLLRAGSSGTQNCSSEIHVRHDLSENPARNTESQNVIYEDQIQHVSKGSQRPHTLNSTCCLTHDSTELLRDKEYNTSGDIKAHLLSSVSFSKTAPSQKQPVKSTKNVDRSSIFYSCAFSDRAGFPAKHILNATRPNSKGALQLFGAIFRDWNNMCSSPKPDTEKFKHCETPKCKLIRCFLKRILQNVRKCQYARLLNRHCSIQKTFAKKMGSFVVSENVNTQVKERDVAGSPHWFTVGFRAPMDQRVCRRSPSDEQVAIASVQVDPGSLLSRQGDISNGETVLADTETKSVNIGKDEMHNDATGSTMEELISGFSSHREVVAFIWAVTRRIIPAQFLGSKKCWRLLRSSLARFISLRRHEKFSLQHYLFGLKTQSFDWLRGVNGAGSDNVLQQSSARHTLELWTHWYFTSFVVPLIRAHFYVTESQNHRKDVFYYRKPVWARIKDLAMTDLLGTSLTKVTPKPLPSTLQGRSLGFSKIRFLPKAKGVRPIVNLGAPSSCIVSSSIQAEPRSLREVFQKAGHSFEKSSFVGSDALKASKEHLSKLRLFFRPVNSVLRDVHSCLKAELEGHAEDLGCSVFDYNDIYLKLVPFVMKLKSSLDGVPRLYFGVCDVSKAFDTIEQPKLCEIINKFLQNEQYSVSRYLSVIPSTGTVRVCFKRACKATLEQHNLLEVLSRKCPHAVYVDQGILKKLSRARILAMLHEHVKKSMLQIGSTFYTQTIGVAQGSVLSSLFCSLFYGHLDRHYVLPSLRAFSEARSTSVLGCHPNAHRDCSGARAQEASGSSLGFGPGVGREELCAVVSENGHQSNWMRQDYDTRGNRFPESVSDCVKFLLLRLTDDSLFISTSKAQVTFFLGRMHHGFAEYGCRANRRKTAVSFDTQLDGQVVHENAYQTEDGARFMRWSGLLVNCHTLEIQADYTRYCGKNIRSTLTVAVEDNQGHTLFVKLCHFMRPKCHPLFYDLNINSPATVRLNAYQAFLLSAMKFHAYARAIPRVGARNPYFLFNAICTSFRYMHRLIQQRMHGIGDASSVTPCFSFPINEMIWLGFLAFRKVLRRKQSSHKELILLLEAELSMKRYTEMESLLYLSSAVDDRRSSMFWSIQY